MFLVRKSIYDRLLRDHERTCHDLTRLYEENQELRERLDEQRKEMLKHRKHSGNEQPLQDSNGNGKGSLYSNGHKLH